MQELEARNRAQAEELFELAEENMAAQAAAQRYEEELRDLSAAHARDQAVWEAREQARLEELIELAEENDRLRAEAEETEERRRAELEAQEEEAALEEGPYANPRRVHYPLAELVPECVRTGQGGVLELHEQHADVDPSRREQYLCDTEFEAVFGMDKPEFQRQRTWKRKQLKSKRGLF